MPFDESELHTMMTFGRQPEPAAGDLGHYLVAIGGADVGRCVEVTPTPITIGRDARQALVFAADNEVSRLHARIALAGSSVIVEDLGSTNGTFVDDSRLTAPVTLREGNVVRVGRQLLKYERRRRDDVARAQELEADLRRASGYVLSLLPAPIPAGAVRTEWQFVPSTQLGGDGFGYYWIDPYTFVFYLIDVSGHGVGPAMHSVTVLNVLRQRALPNVDMRDPGAVLASLNNRFQMMDHGGLFFTAWYGVYSSVSRELAYSSAGHHPSFLLDRSRRDLHPLGTPALMIGVMPGLEFDVQRTTVPPGSSVHVFSDGVFEIVDAKQRRWALSDFLELIPQPQQPGTPEAVRLYRAVTQATATPHLDDDFSLLIVTFE